MSSFDHRPGSGNPLVKKTEASDKRVFIEVGISYIANPTRAIGLTDTMMYIGTHINMRGKANIVVHDTMTGQNTNEIETTERLIVDISLSRDGKGLLVACYSGIAMVVNLDTWKEVFLHGHAFSANCIIQGEGTDVLTCSDDKTIRRWNSLTGECLMIYEGHTGAVHSILYEEATKRIFSASCDKAIIVWNGETGERIGVMEGHGGWVRSLTRVNSTTIASCSWDETIKLWSTTTLACIKTMSIGKGVHSVAVTPDGQYLISGTDDSKVKVRSVATGQCLHNLACHNGRVCKVAVSPDGRFIASSGYDNKVYLHSVSPPF